MPALASRFPALFLALTLGFGLTGCGGNTDTAAPPEDELSQFLEENPDIAAEEPDVGDDAVE